MLTPEVVSVKRDRFFKVQVQEEEKGGFSLGNSSTVRDLSGRITGVCHSSGKVLPVEEEETALHETPRGGFSEHVVVFDCTDKCCTGKVQATLIYRTTDPSKRGKKEGWSKQEPHILKFWYKINLKHIHEDDTVASNRKRYVPRKLPLEVEFCLLKRSQTPLDLKFKINTCSESAKAAKNTTDEIILWVKAVSGGYVSGTNRINNNGHYRSPQGSPAIYVQRVKTEEYNESDEEDDSSYSRGEKRKKISSPVHIKHESASPPFSPNVHSKNNNANGVNSPPNSKQPQSQSTVHINHHLQQNTTGSFPPPNFSPNELEDTSVYINRATNSPRSHFNQNQTPPHQQPPSPQQQLQTPQLTLRFLRDKRYKMFIMNETEKLLDKLKEFIGCKHQVNLQIEEVLTYPQQFYQFKTSMVNAIAANARGTYFLIVGRPYLHMLQRERETAGYYERLYMQALSNCLQQKAGTLRYILSARDIVNRVTNEDKFSEANKILFSTINEFKPNLEVCASLDYQILGLDVIMSSELPSEVVLGLGSDGNFHCGVRVLLTERSYRILDEFVGKKWRHLQKSNLVDTLHEAWSLKIREQFNYTPFNPYGPEIEERLALEEAHPMDVEFRNDQPSLAFDEMWTWKL